MLFSKGRKKGIRFDAVTKRKVGLKIQQLYKEEGFNRIILFLSILNDLAICNNYLLLNANGYALETRPQDTSRIDNIFKYINTNFERSIALEEIADQANMTVPAFCRYFKKETGKTFTKMVNEYRIVHATKLLAESNRSITDISLACGFNNFSHFNKLFNEVAGKTASAYRNELKKMVQ
jgi:AraC-like DNA-binding protein